MNRRGLIITLAVIAFVAIAAGFLLTRTEPGPPQKQEVTQKQESEQIQQATEPRQVPVERQVQQPQMVQQPQEPSEDPDRPQQHEHQLLEPSSELDPHARTVADVSAVRAKLEDYKNRIGEFPATVEGLRALGGAPPKDKWGHDYIYSSPSTRNREAYDLFSAGPDGIPDTPDDDWGEQSEEDNPGNE